MYIFGGRTDEEFLPGLPARDMSMSIGTGNDNDNSNDGTRTTTTTRTTRTILGSRMEIGVAISQDGAHWSRVEGGSGEFEYDTISLLYYKRIYIALLLCCSIFFILVVSYVIPRGVIDSSSVLL